MQRSKKRHSMRHMAPTMLPTKGRLIRLMRLLSSDRFWKDQKKGFASCGALVKELSESLHRRIGTEDHDAVVGLDLHITVDQHRHAVAHQPTEGDALRYV